MKTINLNILKRAALGLMTAAVLTGCSESFLDNKPLSFYTPEDIYATEDGLTAALARCDRSYKDMLMDGNGNVLPIASVYFMTDMGLYAKTDAGSPMDDFAKMITPTSGMAGGGDGNAMKRFYDEANNGIKYANTIISYVDIATGLDQAKRDAFKGRAYFHRAYKYYHQVLLFGDVPLVTKIVDTPKTDYMSTSKEAIFKMLVHDLEFAVEHVPSMREEKGNWGSVNQEACMQLLIKCYLAVGEFKKAEDMATDLINNHGLALMQNSFGTDVPSGNPETWTIQRNVMWDLHRGINIIDGANTETILPLLNYDDNNFTQYLTMRALGVHWSNGVIQSPDGIGGPTQNYARNNGNYNPELDWLRVIGRGIGCFRTSYHYNKYLWWYDGEEDTQDLRHNREVGNWVEMEDLKYNNPSSEYYGKNMQLYATEDYVNEAGETVIHAGQLLCGDTIRSWYPIPLYKMYILDQSAEENMGANQFNGATKGSKPSNGNMYIFRLAETYLLRAEARFYQGKAGEAAEDVNAVRRRANAKKMFTTVTIGDIADERGRELYMEEWRHPELVRMSWALARSGKPDEWGNTYDINTWDKQTGTDATGGSYWYQRCLHYNIFNRGPITSSKELNYRIDKRNLFWPVPQDVINSNNGNILRQNYGYDGYDDNIPMYTDWEEAAANN